MKKQKIIIICGPTGTGKTDLAVKLCQKFNGAIISADSRQVYRGMDIGTGKEVPSIKLQVSKNQEKWNVDGINIYGYDIVEPDEEFSVSLFEDEVFNVYLSKIIKAGKTPFLVGGTGFYIRSIIDGIETSNVPPDLKLRKKLEMIQREKGIGALWQFLKKIDPIKAEKIDRNNPRRLIRAIEITKAPHSKTLLKKFVRDFDLLFIGINWERKKLYERVDQRIDKMITSGLVTEIYKLLESGYNWNLPALNTIGYREFKPFFDKEKQLSECVERLKFNTHAYIRRQLTWFKKDRRIKWFLMERENTQQVMYHQIEIFLQQ